jgi:hypothetical protein
MSLSLLAPKEFQIIILSTSVHTCSLFQKRVVHTKLDVHGFFFKKEDNAMKREWMDTVNFNSHVRWLWFSILWSRYLSVFVVVFVCFGDQAYHDEWSFWFFYQCIVTFFLFFSTADIILYMRMANEIVNMLLTSIGSDPETWFRYYRQKVYHVCFRVDN